MRIIGGKNRSRQIKMVGIETTRETTDMVRESIFNLINQYPIHGYGLDLFSGSGAMGLEALSRGLDYCYFNDLNRKAFNTTKENVKALNYLEQSKIYNLDYKEALKMINNKLDFVFLDPPYKLEVVSEIIDYLYDNKLLNKDFLIICEVDKNYEFNFQNKLDLYKERVYGIRKISIFREAR